MRVRVALVTVFGVLLWAPPATAGDGWTWPVDGRVLTLYSNDNGRPYAGGMHRGIDIAADTGTSVVAARAGTVAHAGVVGSSGLTVSVRTADGRYVTSYLHLSAAAVRRGDAVRAGDRIGAAGTTGRRSVAQPHLHFGVRLAEPTDHYVDPLSLLPPVPAPATAPAAPVPAPAPLRSEAQPAPLRAGVGAPAMAPAPRATGAPVRRSPHARPAPARARPRGTVQPGVAPVPALQPGPAGSGTAGRGWQPGPAGAAAGGRRVRVPARAGARASAGSAGSAGAPTPAGSAASAGSPPSIAHRGAAAHGGAAAHRGAAADRGDALSAPPDRGDRLSGSPDRGRRLVLAGLALIAIAVFGGVAWRALTRANAGVNASAAAAAASIRDRARIAPILGRLLNPQGTK